MSALVTVTVIARDADGRGRDDPGLRVALRDLGLDGPGQRGRGSRTAGAIVDDRARAERDDVYFLSLPDDVEASTLRQFVDGFLAGGPARVAHLCEGLTFPERARGESAILVGRKPGVMDPVEGSVLHALRDAGIDPDGCAVRVAHRFRISGATPPRDALAALAQSSVANPIVDDIHCFLPGESEYLPDPFRSFGARDTGRAEIPLLELNDEQLLQVSIEGGLSLSLEEMQTIQAHFRSKGRHPTEVELESLAQTWSEHCCHKTLTGRIDFDGEPIENLLKETIFAVTEELALPYCLSVFKDNAGVIAINDEWALTFKAETHNHPSALEPYGGAGTGIGGVIRDTLGTGLGARPILSTDVFCLGPLDADTEQLPPGSLHPRRLLTGVVAGVRDYGNRMGIPTANGAIQFHPGYIGNPLVFVGSVGLIPRDCIEKTVEPGDLIVAMGGRTGRDGIHGATFSSRELSEESEVVSAGAVQIGNPIEEKKVLDALLRARDERLYRSVTDCGAGGFSSAVGEMGEDVGADVELADAPLKYPGLSPAEIWISEAQERMVLAVPAQHRQRLFEILAEEEVEGCVLGTFTGDGQLRVRYQGEIVGEIEMAFLHDGRPQSARRATRPAVPRHVEPDLEDVTVNELLETVLAHPSVASKEPVIRQYDHEVQGRMVLRPLQGPHALGPGDGCALDPLRDGRHTVVVACGLQPLLGDVNTYEMGAQSVDEAVRNVIVSGGTLERLALLDNFAWGNVHEPEILGALVECARGAADAARIYGTPFISGKDSLHNTYRSGGVARSIPHTLLISAVSIVDGVPRAPGSSARQAGSRLLLLGPAAAELSGGLVQLLHGGGGGDPALFVGTTGRTVCEHLARWIGDRRVRSCHDLSEGGLAVAAAELGFGSDGCGIRIDIDGAVDSVTALFGEGPHRFLLEVAEDASAALVAEIGEQLCREVGVVTADGMLEIRQDGSELVNRSLAELRELWRAPLFEIWPEEN